MWISKEQLQLQHFQNLLAVSEGRGLQPTFLLGSSVGWPDSPICSNRAWAELAGYLLTLGCRLLDSAGDFEVKGSLQYTLCPVVAQGPFGKHIPLGPTLRGTTQLSGLFGWEPTVTQSALHTCIHTFLSWGRAGLGRHSLPVGLRHQETLCNMHRVIPGGRR